MYRISGVVLASGFIGVSLMLWLTAMPNAVAFDYFQPLPQKPLVPDSNPLTEPKIALGKKLFFDKQLSSKGQLSCNDCHNLAAGGDNNQQYAVGVSGKTTKRNPPTLLNIGLQTVLYWDGRAKTLEEQAKDHLLDRDIMGNRNGAELIERISGDRNYVKSFMNTFNSAHAVTLDNVARALASFQRSLLTPDSAFDRYIEGDKDAISAKAQQGMQIFNDNGCLACHFGVNLAGPAPGPAMGIGDGFYELFPNIRGSRYDKSYNLTEDLGRYEFSNDPTEKYMWRVPMLRNIALTAPYFHNGSAATLEEAVKIMAKTQFNRPLTDEQVDAVVSFLHTLTGETPAVLETRDE
ncbi:MAG: cytochrome c peroxidase [Gammaproteobacteria bacterium]|jgi:cytochrome c peroxidase